MVIVDLTSASSSSCDFSYERDKNAQLQRKFREQIIDATRKHYYSHNVYREVLKYLLNFFGKFTFVDGEGKIKDIPVIHGNQERAIGKIKEKQSLILPLISVSQLSTGNDDERRKISNILVHDKYWDEKAQRAIRILSLAPRPVNIFYSIGIWTAYRADLDQILEQIRIAFNPSIEIATDQSTLAKAFLVDEIDSSDLDLVDGIDRLIRKTLSIEVNTYIESPKFLITSSGKIERFNSETEIC